MRIIYFTNGSGLGTAKSGGVTRQIEISKRLLEKGIKIYIVTTNGAYSLFKRESLKAKYFIVKASLFKKIERSHIDRVISYIFSTIHSLLILKRLPKCDVVYSPSDYFCDVIPALMYKKINKEIKWVAMIHHLCHSPIIRRGNFIINCFSYISQKLSFRLINKFADRILVYDTPEGEVIRQRFINNGFFIKKISSVANGINYSDIKKIKVPIKKYDACFAGGLRASKGIYDLIPIWKRVCEHKKDAKLIVAGEGPQNLIEDFKNKIRLSGIQKNILFTGALESKKLYRIMKESKVFISTSHEEGWGIAIFEALACSVPVVTFELPAFQFLRSYISQIKMFDYESFTSKLVELLNRKKMWLKQKTRAQRFIAKYDWNNIAEKDYAILKGLISNEMRKRY